MEKEGQIYFEPVVEVKLPLFSYLKLTDMTILGATNSKNLTQELGLMQIIVQMTVEPHLLEKNVLIGKYIS